MTRIEKAVQWAISIAENNSHGYSQTNRYGPDYDCSSLVISAFEWAGIPVGGANYTGNMYKCFFLNGWKDVTKEIDLASGEGLIRGDVLLNHTDHTCLYIGNGKVVNARCDTDGRKGDSHGDEIRIQSYWNYPWDCVLRYIENSTENASDSVCDSENIITPVKEKPLRYGELDADSECGKLTVEAIKQFQDFYGLTVDGEAGKEVWSKLSEILSGKIIRYGSKGWHVTALQAALNSVLEDT